MNRRSALTRLAVVVGGIGLAFGSIPFIRYFMPSERAKALGAAVTVDLSTYQPGEVRSVEWRGQAVLIFRRTEEQVASLSLTDTKVLDNSDPEEAQPPYVNVEYRSINPEYLVLLGNCTHLGCIPLRDTDTGKKLLGDWWPGGFHCPCHDSIYDNAGRVVRGPAPSNLRVPPHYFASASALVIGADSVDS